jgi:hypothetical protein
MYTGGHYRHESAEACRRKLTSPISQPAARHFTDPESIARFCRKPIEEVYSRE